MKNLTLPILAIAAFVALLGLGVNSALASGLPVQAEASDNTLAQTPEQNRQPQAGLDSGAYLGIPQPVFMGNTALCDQACQDELESCLPACGTSGPACGCLAAYRECTKACGC